ncbi:putative transcriptional regulator [Methanococcus maripaludis]|uniref:Putative transcriptional regulator n=1 Tax=Methanococcus maripaludis TaxID=39152 RepID=A0A7J9NWL2_METMI|nr:helix-turn-helix domain-containing protein [Methanococcus maripaludis]MBA2851645.1 putative transcriptional regulator [Methanococcus maripaludis]
MSSPKKVVTIQTKPTFPLLFNTITDEKVYLYLLQHHPVTAAVIAKEADIFVSTVRETLLTLTEQGYVIRTKLKSNERGKHPYVYVPLSKDDLIKRAHGEFAKLLDAITELPAKE